MSIDHRKGLPLRVREEETRLGLDSSDREPLHRRLEAIEGELNLPTEVRPPGLSRRLARCEGMTGFQLIVNGPAVGGAEVLLLDPNDYQLADPQERWMGSPISTLALPAGTTRAVLTIPMDDPAWGQNVVIRVRQSNFLWGVAIERVVTHGTAEVDLIGRPNVVAGAGVSAYTGPSLAMTPDIVNADPGNYAKQTRWSIYETTDAIGLAGGPAPTLADGSADGSIDLSGWAPKVHMVEVYGFNSWYADFASTFIETSPA